MTSATWAWKPQKTPETPCGSRTAVLQVWGPHQQYQPHLGACQKCKFSDSTPNTMNQKRWVGARIITNPSWCFWCSKICAPIWLWIRIRWGTYKPTKVQTSSVDTLIYAVWRHWHFKNNPRQFFGKIYLFERERAEWEGRGRRRGRVLNRSCWVQSPTRRLLSGPWYHDLTWNLELDTKLTENQPQAWF